MNFKRRKKRPQTELCPLITLQMCFSNGWGLKVPGVHLFICWKMALIRQGC